ncbi:hypothetical protein [Brachybacterium hainanense]|uniref:Uncharacterized protein n=1 Tax=Brachybacterium hainanense TaxID=1541174 RepID=A0ABV6RIJ8_9MICO
MSDTPPPVSGTALDPVRAGALLRPEFPVARVARRLGIAPADAELALRDPERAREAIGRAAAAYLEADDARRAGRVPTGPLALDPDFPTGVGMALIGAAVLWEVGSLIPRMALRVAKDHYESGDDELAASCIALAQEHAEPGADDASAWAAQSLLVAVLQRSGDPAAADEIARDLVAHDVPLELWRDDDPSLPDDSLAWHGGAFVGGIPPRRDERSLSYEDVHDYLGTMLAQMRREQEAEEDAGHGR